MKRTTSILILLLGASLCAFGCHRQDEGDASVAPSPNSVDYTMAEPGEVVELHTSQEFQDFVLDNEIAVVKFGADWCQPCKLLDPEYDKVAGYFQTSHVAFARADAEELGSVAQTLGIRSIPDTRVYYEGQEYTSVSGNDPFGIANVVNSMCQQVKSTEEIAEEIANKNKPLEDELWDDDNTDAEENEDAEPVFDENLPEEPEAPADDFVLDCDPGEVTVLVSVDDFDAFVKEHDLAVVKFGATWCPPCRMLAPKLPMLAGYFKDAAFADVDVDDSEALAQKFEINAIPDVLVFYKGELKDHVLGYAPEKIMGMLERFVADPENAGPVDEASDTQETAPAEEDASEQAPEEETAPEADEKATETEE